MLGWKIVRRLGNAYASTFVRAPGHVVTYEIGRQVAAPYAPLFFFPDELEGIEIAKWIRSPVEIVLLRVEAAGEIRRMERVSDNDAVIPQFWETVLGGDEWPGELSWRPALPTYAAPLLTPLAVAYTGSRNGRGDEAWGDELEAALVRARGPVQVKPGLWLPTVRA